MKRTTARFYPLPFLLIAIVLSPMLATAQGNSGIWLTPEEIAALPMSGSAWNAVKSAADSNWGTADLGDNNSNHDVMTLAGALVAARTGDAAMRSKVIAGLQSAMASRLTRTLELARGLQSYVIAADLIGYRTPEFEDWVRTMLVTPISGRVGTGLYNNALKDSTNWGGHERASCAAALLYLHDTVRLAEIVRAYREYIGEAVSPKTLTYTNTTWHADPKNKAGVNRLGATIQGQDVSGVLPEDWRRGGEFQWPPIKSGYMWEGMQGFVVTAALLHHAGLVPFSAGNNAVVRAMKQLYYGINYLPESDDAFIPWIVNRYAGTNFPTSAAKYGKGMGWTDWTHAGSTSGGISTPTPLVITTTTLPAGKVGTLYSSALLASGGTLPYSWTLQSGSLPPGMNLLSTGTISGTPTGSGEYTFSAQVKDSAGTPQTASATFKISVAANDPPPPPPLVISTTSLPAGKAGSSYSTQLSASGGTPPYQWSLQSGSLPAGLSLSASGAITGTPTSAGEYPFSVKVQDSGGLPQTASASFTLSVSASDPLTPPPPTPLSITTTSLPYGQAGQPYSAQLAATGGTAPYVWALVSGSLPPGLSLSTSGAISGTPTAAGEYPFQVQVKDSASSPQAALSSFSITTGASELKVTTTSLPEATLNVPYDAQLAGTGGVPPYSWSLYSGQLPPGITLAPSGEISGAPTHNSDYHFEVQMQDSTAAATTAHLMMSVNAPTSGDGPDPVNCTGYPEPRIFLEAQSWWLQTPGQTGTNFGHVHIGTCFPYKQTVSGKVRFDVRVIMHNNPGILSSIDTYISGDGFNTRVYQQSINESFASEPTGTHVRWYTYTVDTTAADYDGRQEFRIRANIQEPDGNRMLVSNGWQVYLANGKPVQNYRASDMTIARGWYTGFGYTNADFLTDIPTAPVSGSWTFRARANSGVSSYSIHLDPDFHAGNPGTILRQGTGTFDGNITVDTTKLLDGKHKILIKANQEEPTGSTKSGVQVIPFVTSNGNTAP